MLSRQHGQDTKEEIASRDLRAELESKEKDAKERREGKTRSFTGQDQSIHCRQDVDN